MIHKFLQSIFVVTALEIMANNVGETVNQAEFDEKVRIHFKNNCKSNNSLWNLKQEHLAIKVLSGIENGVKKTAQHRHFEKLYELVKIGTSVFIVLKRKSVDDPLIYMVPYENYYDKLLEAHLQTGHGGRDRMSYYAKKKWVIFLVEILG